MASNRDDFSYSSSTPDSFTAVVKHGLADCKLDLILNSFDLE